MEKSPATHLTALAILVPEADPIFGPTRERHDSSAAQGAPAHVTMIFPFVPPASLDRRARAQIAEVCASHAAFRFSLTEVRRFPDAVYLAPEPDEGFHRLLRDLLHVFPDYPPYEGKFDGFVPHLTLGTEDSTSVLEQISADFAQSQGDALPIPCVADTLTLLLRDEAGWVPRWGFALGGETVKKENRR